MIGATLHIGVPRENRPRETRVAATPATVTQLVGLALRVDLESMCLCL
jgi:NAD(P) transhydrogenase subunit alpha